MGRGKRKIKNSRILAAQYPHIAKAFTDIAAANMGDGRRMKEVLVPLYTNGWEPTDPISPEELQDIDNFLSDLDEDEWLCLTDGDQDDAELMLGWYQKYQLLQTLLADWFENGLTLK